MPDLDYIVKTPELEKSQDYAYLRKQGVEHIEKLAHRLWSDYNIHDPGITILELLCYAITDLGYRTGYDIADLLTKQVNGVAESAVEQFHTALKVMTGNPVTFDDLRKLLIDIRGARNAWIEPHCSVRYCLDTARERLTDCGPSGTSPGDVIQKNPAVGGLFDAYVEYEDFVRIESRTLHLGLLDNSRGSGDFIQAQGRGIRFSVAYRLVLKAVSVYPRVAGTLSVRLLGPVGSQALASASVRVDRPGEKNRVELDFDIPPGEGYRLVAYGAGPMLYRTTDPAFPYSVENLVYLTSGVRGTDIQGPYYFFYDWEVGYAVPPAAELGAPRATVTLAEPSEFAPGGYIASQDKGILFEAVRDLVLESVVVSGETAGTLRVRLLDAGGAELDRVETSLSKPGEAEKVNLGFRIKGGRSYRLDAYGTTLKLRRSAGAGFPYTAPNVLRLTGGYPSADTLYFFYAWTVSYATQPLPTDITREDVRLAARDRLLRHRNLCEDLVDVCDLQSEQIGVCADIELAPSADVEDVLAEIFYRVGLHVSPRIAFYTIDELLERGKTTDRIFDGPPLEHGFVDDDELRALERRCEIRTSTLIQMIMEVEGVEAVRRLTLIGEIDGEMREEDWVLRLSADGLRVPEFLPDRSKIVLYKNNLPYFANRDLVSEMLAEKKAADLESKLKGHERDLPVPTGEPRNPGDYHPVQNELPMTYRVGQIRVPDSEGALRKAQSRQLKAFLMFFEQLLANYLAQLANVRELFSWSPASTATYFTQRVEGIADLDDVFDQQLISREYAGDLGAALADIVEDEATATERKSRFLEHLIGRFCESFTDYGLLMYGMQQEASLERVIEDKRRFLMDYPALSGARGSGHDYRRPGDPGNLSGYQRRLYRLLGIRDLRRRDLAGHRFEIESVDVVIDGESVERFHFVLDDASGTRIFESVPCESASAIDGLLDFSLGIGGDPGNWRPDPDSDRYQLLRRCAEGADDEVIGNTLSAYPEDLAEVQAYFADIGTAEGFHVIEHVLLRKRSADDPFMPVQLDGTNECRCIEVRDPYSFRVSFVLPSWPRRFQDIKFRAYVEDLLRFEAPAHLVAKICWVSHAQMRELEICYDDFQKRLAALSRGLGDCRMSDTPPDEAPSSGELPLPATDTSPRQDYAESLDKLIEAMHGLVNVYPLAKLHDCEHTTGDAPQITLNNTTLGTF